jgi:hypothetical protein
VTYGDQSLLQALEAHGLETRPADSNTYGRILIQNGHPVATITPATGWALVRLMDGKPTDGYAAHIVSRARAILADLRGE